MKRILRIILGLVFMFSGFVKAVDPWGGAYKLQEYFHSANIFYLDSIALILAIALSTIEFITGFSLTLGIYKKLAGKIGLLFMLIFTPVTLYLAIYNPVTDCGCFGDAIKLSNYETFGKNVVLLLMALIIVYSKKEDRIVSKTFQRLSLLSASILIIGISYLSYYFLPIIDFRPYKIGTNIAEKMLIPEGSPIDEYKTSFIYEKNGEKKEFSLSEIPDSNTGWNFVDQKSILITKGYEPPIHDFSIYDPEMGDITDLLIQSQGYAILVLSKKLEEAPPRIFKKINTLYDLSLRDSIPFFFVSSSDDETIAHVKQQMNIHYSVFTMDETTIKTIIRSNPGVIIIKDGIIKNKLSYNSFPKDWSELFKSK